MTGRTLFVGIGSPHGDDRAGWEVAEQLACLAGDNLEIRKASSPSDILDWLSGVDRFVVFDACRGSGKLGHIACWHWPNAQLSQLRTSGTHDLGLSHVLELAATLGALPSDVEIWTVEAGECRPNADVSREIATALPSAVADIRKKLCHA